MSEAKKKRVTREHWERAIRTARQYTSDYSKVRWIIADLALEVCDYSHGGRKGESIYSLRQFAEEIELDRKTLYQWIRVKRLVFDKLPKMIQAKAHKYNYNDFDLVSNQVQEETSKAEVYKRWDEHMKQPPESRKVEKYIRHLSAIFYNVSRPMIMKDVNEQHITTVIEKCEVIVALCKKELELRTKFSTEARTRKRLNMKNEVAKRIGA